MAFRHVFGREAICLRPSSDFNVEDNIVALENSPDKIVSPDAARAFESDIGGTRPFQLPLRVSCAGLFDGMAEAQGQRRQKRGDNYVTSSSPRDKYVARIGIEP
jgi:hypothetical protein